MKKDLQSAITSKKWNGIDDTKRMNLPLVGAEANIEKELIHSMSSLSILKDQINEKLKFALSKNKSKKWEMTKYALLGNFGSISEQTPHRDYKDSTK